MRFSTERLKAKDENKKLVDLFKPPEVNDIPAVAPKTDANPKTGDKPKTDDKPKGSKGSRRMLRRGLWSS
jgi:hypothetical protein